MDRIIAIGVARLGMSVEEVLKLTPRRFNSILEEHARVEEKRDKWFAILASAVMNGYSRKRVKPEDFLQKKKKAQTPEEMLEVVKQFVR